MDKINIHAPVTCSKKISIDASEEIIWTTLSNINDWPNWETDISKATLNGKLSVGESFTWKSAGTQIKSTLTVVDPFKNLAWKGKAMGVSAIHHWTISSLAGLSEVSVDESMDGFIVKLFRKMFQRNLENSLQRWLEELKLACEIKMKKT